MNSYKACSCYITNHFNTTITDINMQMQTHSKSDIYLFLFLQITMFTVQIWVYMTSIFKMSAEKSEK